MIRSTELVSKKSPCSQRGAGVSIEQKKKLHETRELHFHETPLDQIRTKLCHNRTWGTKYRLKLGELSFLSVDWSNQTRTKACGLTTINQSGAIAIVATVPTSFVCLQMEATAVFCLGPRLWRGVAWALTCALSSRNRRCRSSSCQRSLRCCAKWSLLQKQREKQNKHKKHQ